MWADKRMMKENISSQRKTNKKQTKKLLPFLKEWLILWLCWCKPRDTKVTFKVYVVHLVRGYRDALNRSNRREVGWSSVANGMKYTDIYCWKAMKVSLTSIIMSLCSPIKSLFIVIHVRNTACDTFKCVRFQSFSDIQ